MAVNITLKDIYSKFLHISNKIFTFCIKYVNNLEPGFIQCSETEQGAVSIFSYFEPEISMSVTLT